MQIRQRKVFRMVAALFAVGDVAWRIFSDVRPIDWLVVGVDALVLLVILCEWGVGEYRLRNERRERRRLAAIVAELSGFIDKGHKLTMDIPSPTDPGALRVWRDKAKTWREETNVFLLSRSSRASAAFQLVLHTGIHARVVETASGGSFSIDGPIRHSYERLMTELDNLRGISEKPEAYF